MNIIEGVPDPACILPLQQHPFFAGALRHVGHSAKSFRVQDGGRLIADVLMIQRSFPGLGHLGVAVRGPVWAKEADSDARQRALRLLRQQGLWMIEAELSGDPALRAAGFRKVVTQSHVAELDLTAWAARRRQRLDPKWRNHLAQAERSGLKVRVHPFAGSHDHWLLRAEAGQRRDRGYKALPQSIAVAFAMENPDMARVFQIDENGEPIAGMLILRHGPVATYHIGWTGARGRAVSAHHLILMTAADWLAQAGHTRLDLGSVDTEGAEGLARFKIGSGAFIRPLGGSWIRVPGL